jgi:hypothetical protein
MVVIPLDFEIKTFGFEAPDVPENPIRSNGNSKQHLTVIFYHKFNSLDTNALQDHLTDTPA